MKRVFRRVPPRTTVALRRGRMEGGQAFPSLTAVKIGIGGRGCPVGILARWERRIRHAQERAILPERYLGQPRHASLIRFPMEK